MIALVSVVFHRLLFFVRECSKGACSGWSYRLGEESGGEHPLPLQDARCFRYSCLGVFHGGQLHSEEKCSGTLNAARSPLRHVLLAPMSSSFTFLAQTSHCTLPRSQRVSHIFITGANSSLEETFPMAGRRVFAPNAAHLQCNPLCTRSIILGPRPML